MQLREMWRRVFRTKYSGLLEMEVARLRAENRALLNSILGIAGVPPIAVTADDPMLSVRGRPAAAVPVTAQKNEVRGATDKRASAKMLTGVAAPTRRRSWHQVYRMLEIDSARKKEVV